jgi:hypothetical protein
MDEIDRCRNPMPCELCRQRMQSILDMGAAAERERVIRLAEDHEAHCSHCDECREPVAFADLLRGEPS